MASPVANGASSEANGSTPRSNAAAGHQQGKSSFTAKMSESSRKLEEDGTQRRSAQPKGAWTTGMNPITQRSNTPSQMNGASAKSTNGAEKAVDRQSWMYCNAVGLLCTITLKGGEKFAGVFGGAQKPGDNQRLAFKMVRDISKDPANKEFCGTGPEHVMAFPSSLVETFEVPEAPILARAATNGAHGSFRTDTDISGNLAARERNLQRWEAPTSKGADMSLESSSSSGQWDQFKANEQLFGVKSDYDENIYTTSIDRTSSRYAQDSVRAERIAAEIESSVATNAHVREERGLDEDGGDEEEKYSGVRRDYQPLQTNQPGRYIPPSKRNQEPAIGAAAAATKPTPDKTVDPAIISSQIARTEAPTEASKAPAAVKSTTAAAVAPATAPASNLMINTSASSKDTKPAKTSSKGVENDVLDSFRQFAANEKIKVQDQKRSRAFQDKAVKLNDLMKFSQNFKLLTPIPKDLVPILAKDETKQKEIVQKAQVNAQSSSAKASASTADQKPTRTIAVLENDKSASGVAASSKDSTRQAPSSQTPVNKDRPAAPVAPSQPPQGSLSTRLTNNHQAHTARVSGSIPNALPLQDNRGPKTTQRNYSNMPSPQKGTTPRGPPSATSLKFNAKAMEFNPNASSFKPGSFSGPTVSSSPRSGPATRTISPAGPPQSIFGDRKDFTIPETKNPAKVVVASPPDPDADGNGNVEAKAASKALAANGGFFPPYRTAPTWPVDDPDNGPDHKSIFEERRPKRAIAPQTHSSPATAAMAYQLPHHMQQGGPHIQPHHHVPHTQPPQPHHFSHSQQFEDNHMRPSQSQSSFAHSPRMPGAQPVHYPSPMQQSANLAYQSTMAYPQAHPMGQRQFSNPPPQHIMPIQNAHLTAPTMMIQGQPNLMPQQITMPFNPQQMPVFTTAQPVYGTPGQPPNGYPSPGRGGGHIMMHQGSQQGQQPVYMPQHGQPPHGQGQPVYAQYQPGQMPGVRAGFGSPQPPFAHANYPQHQQHHFTHQPHRTPSSGYAQPHQPQHHPNVQAQHGPPQPTGPAEITEDAK